VFGWRKFARRCLSLGQKESLLNVAKNFVGLREETGKSFSWEEVKEMALNKDKRNGL
jgi:hypothetical protein